MKTAEEILAEKAGGYGWATDNRVMADLALEAMREYGREVLDLAAERAMVEVENSPLYTDPSMSKTITMPDKTEFSVSKDSILKLKDLIK